MSMTRQPALFKDKDEVEAKIGGTVGNFKFTNYNNWPKPIILAFVDEFPQAQSMTWNSFDIFLKRVTYPSASDMISADVLLKEK